MSVPHLVSDPVPKPKPLDPFDPEVIARSNRAILVGLQRQGETAAEAQSLLNELHELVENLGVEIRGSLIARIREESPRHLVGSGKMEEISKLAHDKECGLVIFDDELTPAQTRNLEKIFGRRVMDRTALILEIFSQRARTREGKMQIELAQLEYLRPRLTKFWGHLSRQRGISYTGLIACSLEYSACLDHPYGLN